MKTRRACVGFSLLEILVAFVIMALALGVLMRVFSGALTNTAVSERYATAMIIAQSRLAAVGIETPLAETENSGETEDGYRWLTRVTREQADQDSADLSHFVGLFRVEVEVNWQDGVGEKARQVRLVTLRAGPVP